MSIYGHDLDNPCEVRCLDIEDEVAEGIVCVLGLMSLFYERVRLSDSNKVTLKATLCDNLGTELSAK